jgi:hypothetical protein
LPAGHLEKQIADVWNALFAPRQVTIKDDFLLDICGNSQ